MTTVQKIIKIGSSKGVTLPAKQLKQLGVEVGDEVEITIRSKTPQNSHAIAVAKASALLDSYEEDFKNLSNR